MNTGVTDWLPKSAFSEDAVKAALKQLVGSWSVQWFSRRTAVISAVRLRDGLLVPVGPKCLYFRRGLVAAELTDRGKRHLLEAALEVDLSQQTLSDGDRAMLGAFAPKIVEDLVSRLDEAFGEAGAGGGAGEQINLTLAVEKNDLLTLSFPNYAVVPMLKAGFGGVRSQTRNLYSRTAALAPTPIIAEGLLGKAELGVKEFRGLAVGDVLVLDRSLQEAVELRLCGSTQPIARGTLTRNGGQISIAL